MKRRLMTILHLRFGKRLLWMGVLQTFILLLLFAGRYQAVAEAEAGEPHDPNKENSRIWITADKLVAQLDASEIEYIGNVKATRADAIITSDRLKIIYDPDMIKKKKGASRAESIEKVIASGHVKIVTDNIIAKTDKAEYSIKSEVLILQGKQSSVTRGNDSITGSKFTLRRTEGKIIVESSEKNRVKAILQP